MRTTEKRSECARARERESDTAREEGVDPRVVSRLVDSFLPFFWLGGRNADPKDPADYTILILYFGGLGYPDVTFGGPTKSIRRVGEQRVRLPGGQVAIGVDFLCRRGCTIGRKGSTAFREFPRNKEVPMCYARSVILRPFVPPFRISGSWDISSGKSVQNIALKQLFRLFFCCRPVSLVSARSSLSPAGAITLFRSRKGRAKKRVQHQAQLGYCCVPVLPI